MSNLLDASKFTKAVIDNRGALVAPLDRQRTCSNCYCRLAKGRPVVHWTAQSKFICTECAKHFLEFNNLIELADDGIDSVFTSDKRLLEVMQMGALERIAIVVEWNELVLDSNAFYYGRKSKVKFDKHQKKVFKLFVQCVVYAGDDFQSGLLRVMSAYYLNQIMKSYPAIIGPLCELAATGDKEFLLGVLRVLPTVNWGRTEKLRLLSYGMNSKDEAVLKALNTNLNKLGINDKYDMKFALKCQPVIDELLEIFETADLKRIHKSVFKYIPGAGTGKKCSDLAFDIAKITLGDKEVKEFFHALPNELQGLIKHLLWCRIPPDFIEVERELGLKITRTEKINQWSQKEQVVVENAYTGFIELTAVSGQHIGLVIIGYFARRLQRILPKPDAAKLSGPEDIPDISYSSRIEYNPDFIALLPNIHAKIKQRIIPLKKNGMPSVAGCRKIATSGGNYHEFYPDHKQLRQLRSELLYRVFLQSIIPENVSYTPEVIAKALLDSLFERVYSEEKHQDFDYNYNYHNIIPKLMKHVVWECYGLNESFEKEYTNSIRQLMKAMPKGRWVTIDQCLDYLFLNELKLSSDIAHNFMSFTAPDSWGYKRRIILDSQNIQQIWEEPLIGIFMLLLAAVGALDIACVNPVSKGYCHGNREYLSYGDGVVAVRLNSLGEWYFQGADNSCFTKQDSGIIVPDEKRLLLQLRGNDIALRTSLEQTAKPVGGGFYSIDSGSFLDECKSEDAVVNKINAFKALLPEELPPVWQEFFEKTLARLNPLKIVKTDYTILQLEDAPELKKLLISNPILRKNITLAEGGLILIAKKNIRPLKKKLAELGFFVDSF